MTRISVKSARKFHIGNPTSVEMKADAEKLAKFIFYASSYNVEIKYLVEEIVKLKAEELNKSKRPPGQKQIMVCPRCGSQYPSDIQHMC